MFRREVFEGAHGSRLIPDGSFECFHEFASAPFVADEPMAPSCWQWRPIGLFAKITHGLKYFDQGSVQPFVFVVLIHWPSCAKCAREFFLLAIDAHEDEVVELGVAHEGVRLGIEEPTFLAVIVGAGQGDDAQIGDVVEIEVVGDVPNGAIVDVSG